eukprot:g3052.t1
MKARGVENETVMGVGSWMISSVSMMILNKRAIDAFPHEIPGWQLQHPRFQSLTIRCTLTAMQMLFSVCVLLCGFRYIRIGSLKDVLRWCLVTPFFSGMLLTSMLALKNASMTLVIVFRCLSPLLSLPIEVLCYPRPLRLSATSFAALLGMGTQCVHLLEPPLVEDRLRGLQWVLLNMVLDVAHRLNATRTPFVTGILVEVAFASLMTRWMAESTREKSPLFNVSEEFIVQALWTVFGISVLGRCLCLLYSHRAILHRRSGRVVTILYMFCGTTQWLFNLSVYYLAYDAASYVERIHHVHVGLSNTPVFFENHTSLTNCLMKNRWRRPVDRR